MTSLNHVERRETRPATVHSPPGRSVSHWKWCNTSSSTGAAST